MAANARFSVRARMDVVVRDPAALQAYAAQRLLDAGAYNEDELDEHVRDPRSALYQLLALDLSIDYPGTEDGGAGWELEPTEKTLYEMTPEERDEAGI